jgi:hypothetical protein
MTDDRFDCDEVDEVTLALSYFVSEIAHDPALFLVMITGEDAVVRASLLSQIDPPIAYA